MTKTYERLSDGTLCCNGESIPPVAGNKDWERAQAELLAGKAVVVQKAVPVAVDGEKLRRSQLLADLKALEVLV